MYEPDEDDVVEQGGAPLRLPGWARRPRWLPAGRLPDGRRRPSRGATVLGIAGLIVGLAAGYAIGFRHPGQAVRPPQTAPSRVTAAAAAPSTVVGFAAQAYPPPPPGGAAYSSGLGITGLSGLAQTGGECSVQHGRDLQLGVEVINLSEKPVTLGQAKPILPLGGLRLVSQQWAPCGAVSPSWQAADGGMIVYVKSSTGEVIEGSAIPTGAAVLPPNGTAWLSATFQVLVTCPRPLSVQFSVGYQENGRKGTAQLAGFLDIGQVSYTGCKGNS
jgi:hypothetical protein